jgi:hypothetical protein
MAVLRLVYPPWFCPGGQDEAPSPQGHRPAGPHPLRPLTASHVKPYGHTHGPGPTVSTANRASTTAFLISDTARFLRLSVLRVTSRTRRRGKYQEPFKFLYSFRCFFWLSRCVGSFFFYFSSPAGFFTGKGERRGRMPPFTAVGC